MRSSLIPEDARPYTDALKSLGRQGANAARVEDTPLVNLPVVTQANPDAPAEVKADVFLQALNSAVNGQIQGESREKAAIYFALGDWAGKPLQERYAAISVIHCGRPSGWELFRKEPLDRLLMEVLTALDRESRAQTKSVSSNKDGDSRVVNTYRLVNYEAFYNLSEKPGELRETLIRRKLRATVDGLDKIRIGSRYWGLNPEQAPTMTVFGPGNLEVVQDQRLLQAPHPGRAYLTSVAFPKALKKGESVDFSILRRHKTEPDELARRDWYSQKDLAPIVPVEHARIGVRFPGVHTPQVIWHFEDLREYLSPGAPNDTNKLTLDSSGYVEFSWSDLLVGHAYGIAWQW